MGNIPSHIFIMTSSDSLKPIVNTEPIDRVPNFQQFFYRMSTSSFVWHINHHYEMLTIEGKRVWWRESNTVKSRAHKSRSEAYALRQRIVECTDSNGQIAVVRSGMDCDCATFCDVHFMNANWYDFQTYVDEDRSWADGPVNYSIITPEESGGFVPPPSRDLALEAFEDGHPSTVSEVRYENN